MKRFIAPIIILILATVGYFVAQELLSYRTATFILDPSVESISIHSSADSDEATPSLKTLTPQNSSIRLKEGAYYYIPSGDDVSNTQVPFVVAGDVTLTVKPGYSTRKLAELATTELGAVQGALLQKYPSVINGFEVNNLALVQRGEWAGIILTPVGMDTSNPEGYYRAILHKVNSQWQVVGAPRIVLTLDNTPTVSRELLTSVNELSLR